MTTLFGVGPERATQLGRLGISTVEDLLLHRPHRYEDRRQLRPIAQLELHQAATTRGTIVAQGTKWFKHHSKSIFEIVLDDGTARLHCRWWNLPFMEKYFTTGDEVIVFGKLLALKPRVIDHPETEVIEAGEESQIHFNRITPVYPLTEGLPQRWLRGLIWRTLAACESHIVEPWPQVMGRVTGDECRGTSDPVGTRSGASPASSPVTHHASRITHPILPSRAQAIHSLHFPERMEDIETARRRLALDEFVELQRRIQLRRRNFESKAQALPCHGDNHLMKPFLARLGFKLTPAQTEVLRHIRKDLSGPYPMRRLLQGDVGSGKTVVAACASLMALESGFNVALMAPTEILAEQHYANFQRWFSPLGVKIQLRTGAHKPVPTPSLSPITQPAARRTASSPVTLFIGTHALFQAGFTADNLGLVIIDEQHKFGVSQREELVRKGCYPHLLVMTATPIPRTLGLTLYGELDISTIGQQPPGRGRIQTFVRTADKLPQVWTFLRDHLGRGRQAYVVYPRVEESGAGGLKAVTQEFEHLQQALKPFRVGLLHGRLKSREKEQVMAGFRANEVQVLLATALIEVGLDIPNATLMLVENAEQFGLAQLHQLRGRIGRGAKDSYCILVAAAKSLEARQRLRVFEQANDGFELAEADLKLRGPGELLGQEQSGVPKFRFGDLNTDLELIRLARELASQLEG